MSETREEGRSRSALLVAGDSCWVRRARAGWVNIVVVFVVGAS